MPRRSGTKFAVAAVAATMLVLAGCASSPEPSDTTNPDAEPIKIMVSGVVDSNLLAIKSMEPSMKAAIEEINAAGGINGVPLEGIFCDNKFDVNAATACGRQAVDDGVAAVVGSLTGHAASILPTLEDAGIPWVLSSGSSGPIELNCPICFTSNAGAAGFSLAIGRFLADEGGDAVTVIATEDEGSTAAGHAAQTGAEAGGATVEFLSVPAGLADYAAAATAAVQGNPDGIAVTTPNSDVVKIIAALRSAGFEGPISTGSAVLPQSSIDALGAGSANVFLAYKMALLSNTEVEGIARYLEAYDAQNPEVAPDEPGLNTWLAVHMFAQAAQRVDGEVTAESVRQVLLDPGEPISLFGVLPDYPGFPDPAVYEDFVALPQMVAVMGEVIDGVPVQITDPFNPLE